MDTREYIWNKTPRYLKRILVGFDEFANILLNGRVGDCVSSRVGRNIKENEFWSLFLFGPLIDFVFGKNHCINKIEIAQTDHE